MINIVTIDVSQNNFIDNPRFTLKTQQTINFDGREIEKLTYVDSQNMAWKICKVVLAILASIASFGIVLCFSKGRAIWTNTCSLFKEHIIYQRLYEDPTNANTQIPVAHVQTAPIPATQIPIVQVQAVQHSILAPKPAAPIPNPAPNATLETSSLPPPPPQPSLAVAQTAQVQQVIPTALKEIQKILKANPHWQSHVTKWLIPLSLDQRLWLLQIFELRQLGIHFTCIDTLIGSTDFRSIAGPGTIQAVWKARNEIEKVINQTQQLDLNNKGLDDCPAAISLLANLTILNLSKNRLTKLPDISALVKLKELELSHNAFIDPPNLTQHLDLYVLDLSHNKLKAPPDLQWNTKLTVLDLSNNQLDSAPDFTKHKKLCYVDLSNNKITDVNFENNEALTCIKINFNKLSRPPKLPSTFLASPIKNYELSLFENLIPEKIQENFASSLSSNINFARLSLSM